MIYFKNTGFRRWVSKYRLLTGLC